MKNGYKELILYIAKALVDHPEEVRVLEEKGDTRPGPARSRPGSAEGSRGLSSAGGAGVHLRILAREEDRGRIIGKGGRTIRALRTLLFTAASVSGARATLEVSDDEKE